MAAREYVLFNWHGRAMHRPAVAPTWRQALTELASFCSLIRADGVITDLEAAALAGWLSEHTEVMGLMGLADLPVRLSAILADLVITDDERAELVPMVDAILEAIGCGRPEDPRPGFRLDEPETLTPDGAGGVVITGNFLLGKRSVIEGMLKAQGWPVHDRVTGDCVLVVVGAVPSPMWSRGSYGNKIAAVLTMRERGGRAPLLVSEEHWRKLHDGG